MKMIRFVACWLTAMFASGANAQNIVWTGTWAASPLHMQADPDSNGTINNFAGRTLRQVVRISIGGTSVRIHLSNRFGIKPVTISDVHFAKAASDRAAVAGTDRRVTFRGSGSITIPAQGEVDSDPISMTLAANSDVSVSMYFPQAVDTNNLTAHRQAWQSVYLASGDVSASPTLSVTSSLVNLFFLTNIDVTNTGAAGAVVTLGASITDSSNSSFGQNRRWTNELSNRLVRMGLTVGVLNAGLSGNHLLTDEVFGGPSAANRFQKDVLSQPNVKWVIFSDDPINDLSGRFGTDVQSLEQFTTPVMQMTAAAHAKGVKFYCSTLTPTSGRPDWSPEAETRRQQINDFYKTTQSGCDSVVDLDAATRNPASPLQFLPAYDAGDFVHPNDAGMVAIANSVNLGLFTTNGVPPFTAPDSARCGTLLANQGFGRNQPLTSCDGRFQAWLQGDGNFVIYQGPDALGATNTGGTDARFATLLADGSFALFSDHGKIVWQTQTQGRQGGVLLLQNDGNLVLYSSDTPDAQPVWSSNTFGQ